MKLKDDSRILHPATPATKGIASLLCLATLMVADTANCPDAIVAALSIILLPLFIHTKIARLTSRLMQLMPLVLLAVLAGILIQSVHPEVFFIHFLWRPLAIIYPLLCLMYSGPVDELLAVASRLPLPRPLLAVSVLTLYHLRRVRRLWLQTKLAFEARAFTKATLQRLRLAGSLSTALLKRMLDTAEVTEMSLYARGFTGRLASHQKQIAGIWDSLVILTFSMILAGVLWL